MEQIQPLLPLVLILVVARVAGLASRRIGMPAVLGELLAGVLLGPSILGWITMDPTLGSMAEIGVLLLMFVAGLETDLAQMRSVGKASLLTALGGVILPFGGGFVVGQAAGIDMAGSLFLGAALTATSVSVSVQVLNEAGSLRTRTGMVILGAAISDDIMGVLVLSLVIAFAGQAQGAGLALLRMVAFFPVAVLAGRFVLAPLVSWISRSHAREEGMALVMAVVVVSAWLAEKLGGVAAITGAYMVGVLIANLPDHKEWISKGALAMGQGLFVPVFFVAIGLQADFHSILSAPLFALALIAVAVVTKALGAALGARAGGFTWPDARVVGAGMIARGEVAIVVAAIGLNNAIISPSVFTIVIVMTLATTLVTPLLLRLTLPARQSSATAAAQGTTYLPVAAEAKSS